MLNFWRMTTNVGNETVFCCVEKRGSSHNVLHTRNCTHLFKTQGTCPGPYVTIIYSKVAKSTDDILALFDDSSGNSFYCLSKRHQSRSHILIYLFCLKGTMSIILVEKAKKNIQDSRTISGN